MTKPWPGLVRAALALHTVVGVASRTTGTGRSPTGLSHSGDEDGRSGKNRELTTGFQRRADLSWN